ncbi:thiamine pyrophosphate-dependent enzyme [Streptomyces sp. NPDC051896]|uniref:thiamine pyrophosphate-dependent enzyme n=1 Tax=Streptomyces sp. NPDC051896 TaxID=3155416 RepID=UPI00342CF76A
MVNVSEAALPGAAACRFVTVDREPADCPLDRARPAVRVNGDISAALEALLPLLSRAADRTWRARVEETVRSSRAAGRTRANRYFGTSVNPRAVVAELSARLPDRAVVVTDSGTSLDWWTRAAVPYAVAARLAAPDRPVVALVGDAAFQAGGLNELITIRRHLDRLAGLPPRWCSAS